ncbi:hypothetical protein EBR56_11565, partial [bacterium]|nr:hypothetical protein [bacterium]
MRVGLDLLLVVGRRPTPAALGLAAPHVGGNVSRASRAVGPQPEAPHRALERAARRIEDFYKRLKPVDMLYTDAAGVRLGLRYTPIDAVGLYVPGGSAGYPSS